MHSCDIAKCNPTTIQKRIANSGNHSSYITLLHSGSHSVDKTIKIMINYQISSTIITTSRRISWSCAWCVDGRGQELQVLYHNANMQFSSAIPQTELEMQQLNVVLFVYWIIYIFQPLQTIHYTRLELSAFQIFLICGDGISITSGGFDM